jgi:single-stranded DNA-binding protein
MLETNFLPCLERGLAWREPDGFNHLTGRNTQQKHQPRKENIMNICAVSGRLVRNAVLRGSNKKVLLFTLACRNGGEESEQKDRVQYVPCAVFNPSPELEKALVTEGQGTHVELEGRIGSSSYESNGERKFTTEVVAFNRSITWHKAPETAA